jgi:Domain of unknown function (DUF222)
LVRGQLGDPKLGVHNGLPVTVIVSTTLQELAAGAGRAMTGGGTLLPTRDLIRMASRAYRYLAVFDEHQSRPLYLGRARRIASADQRVVLYAKDRRCTAPAATSRLLDGSSPRRRLGPRRPDRHRQVDLACKPDHKMADKGWRTIKLANGQIQWIPPPHLDHGQARTNHYHHPGRFFGEERVKGRSPRDCL